MDEEETVCCCSCLAEPCEGEDGQLDMTGWDTEAEYGLTCPECVVEQRGPRDGEPGLDGFAEAVGAEKTEEDPEPYGIEFSAQVNPGPFGGCVDPPYTEPYVPEEPKPDTGVRMTKTGNKEKP